MSSSQTPSPPSHNATPLEVRDYFAGVLFNFHDVSLEQAYEIAAKWEYGRGSELTYYDVATFRSIFGAEAGTLLYGYARKELRTSRTGPSGNLGNRGILEKPQKDIFGATPGLSIVYGLFVLSILSLFQTLIEYRMEKMDGALAFGSICFFLFAGFIVSYVTYYFGPEPQRRGP